MKSGSNQILDILKINNEKGNEICEIKLNTKSKIKSNTRLLLTFENNTINSTTITDLSGYNRKSNLTMYNLIKLELMEILPISQKITMKDSNLTKTY